MTAAPDLSPLRRRPVAELGPAREMLRRAVDHLASRQDAEGWWKGELATNVTMDAEDLLLRAFLGILTDEQLDSSARWIRSRQRADGTWASFHGGPPELSTTVEAYAALRLAGDAVDSEHLVRAREWILGHGGLEGTRVFTRIWLALVGQWSWDELPAMPPELIRLPSWVPLNVYDWACWARQTVVPLTVVAAHRPVRDIGLDVSELRVGGTPAERVPRRPWTVAGAFQRLDTVLHAYERSPIKPGREASIRRAVEWIIARQESDGGWGGIQPPWVYSILAMHLSGYALNHPAMKAAIDGLEGFLLREDTPDGPIRRLEACQSPVWDTCLAVVALRDAGVPADDPVVVSATRWLLGEEIGVRGDWSVRRPELPPGGWAFEFANDFYPDVDDTAEVVLALGKVGEQAVPGVDAAIARGVAWTVGMRSADCGWGAFDADNTRYLINELPFCDFGAVIDPPSADVTAHVVEMLAHHARPQDAEALAGGVRWLLDAQEPDGSWFGRWGTNYVYGTGAAVPALVAAGVSPEAPSIRRAVDWLAAHQNPDGGWGEDMRSYVDADWVGRGESTASQTAWALLALLAADADRDPERAELVERGIGYLAASQRADGGWDEDLYTGTGFPGDFYLNYEMYRLVFPISAIGRYLSRAAAPGADEPARDGSRPR